MKYREELWGPNYFGVSYHWRRLACMAAGFGCVEDGLLWGAP